ncbi:hypothetical protein HELRODRAFT_176560 [Helobdella robusta]|uniref:Uncharacterized protein n=1 Tax=Helobdella robusta TaxID=6412 RepID=T1FAN5_HELRO|nr:hypothetical protein HELRODRAFT_176560 [Helobdella robusta]ESN99794.1 hypothetical protein HELRODRAFT_176560 [Helobdella robusta]
MVKKSDKPASKSTSRLSNHEELGADNNIKEEPYVCAGNFKQDFEVLCQKFTLIYTPPIKPRKPKISANVDSSPLPAATPNIDERTKSSKGSKKSVSKNELKSESVATVNNDASENDAKCPPSGKDIDSKGQKER